MKIVGLTGGIGSGKTTVSNIFSSLGVPIFNADYEAKELYRDPEVIRQTMDILRSDDITDFHGNVIRSKVAAIIFTDPLKRIALNNLIHPLVKKRFAEWVSGQHFPYCIREAAILIESGSYQDCQEIIVVVSPLEERIKRVMQRDGAKKEEVEKRIHAQMKDEERIKYATFIIHNDEKEEDLIVQVSQIHHQLIS